MHPLDHWHAHHDRDRDPCTRVLYLSTSPLTAAALIPQCSASSLVWALTIESTRGIPPPRIHRTTSFQSFYKVEYDACTFRHVHFDANKFIQPKKNPPASCCHSPGADTRRAFSGNPAATDSVVRRPMAELETNNMMKIMGGVVCGRTTCIAVPACSYCTKPVGCWPRRTSCFCSICGHVPVLMRSANNKLGRQLKKTVLRA